MAPATPFWTPPNAGRMPMDNYRRHINTKFSQDLKDTKQLQRWSVANQQDFWIDMYSYLKLTPPLPPTIRKAYDEKVPISSVPKFFGGHRMNYAENVLFANPDDNAVALIGVREAQDLSKRDEETVTWSQLREKVRIVASALRHHGIKEGDRVAALVANSVWAIVLFLASAAIGAIFSSINPDLGIEGCVSRLVQITPSILFCDADAAYKGKRQSVIPKLTQILERLQHRPHVFVIPVQSQTDKYPSIDEFTSTASKSDPLKFRRVPFDSPLVICYSSGTTGAPKCIVHQHGLILQLKKISTLHNSLTPKDVVMQYSSTSWVVFYIMNGHLSTGATTICYDGSPMWPDVAKLIRLCERFRYSHRPHLAIKVNRLTMRHSATYLGTSPRYLLELEIAKIVPKQFDLRIRMVNTTGAPLSLDQYDWFYANMPPNVHLSNTAGGTDTSTSLLASDPSGPLYKGEMQMIAIGMDIDIVDENGSSIAHTGQPGEMIIRKPFPSMPVFFWGDKDGKIYKSSYFERFDNIDVWAQHDWLARNPQTGGFVMSGRSDGVLNPSGIRFGSGEIYGIVEGPQFNSEIAETLCVGRRRPQDKDETVFLFIKMLPDRSFTSELEDRVRATIREGLSQRHVPRFILQVKDIPVTINGKKVEIAVKQLISGKEISISSTVANPETLRSYRQYRDLESSPRGSRL